MIVLMILSCHRPLYFNWWVSTFDVGAWRMIFPEAMDIDEVGVGGDNVPDVTLGHICKQTLQ